VRQLVFVSFGGQRSWRYLYFAMSFMFVLWGIALVSIWYALRDLVLRAIDRVGQPGRAWPQVAVWLDSPDWQLRFPASGERRSGQDAAQTGRHQLGEGVSAGWPDVVPQLQDLVRNADVVVTSHELHMLYYLGRADIVVSTERLAEFSDAEFGRDRRTGLPAVSQAQSLELTMSCMAMA
jgi:hypothetical protein